MSKVVNYYCDGCNRSEQHIHGWFSIMDVDFRVPSTHRVNDRKQVMFSQKDFCSESCMMRYIKKSIDGSEINVRQAPSSGVDFSDYGSEPLGEVGDSVGQSPQEYFSNNPESDVPVEPKKGFDGDKSRRFWGFSKK